MEVIAKTRYLRMSPRKVRLVMGLVRGLTVAQARVQLRFLNKAAAEPVLKLINSAAANATHNFGMDEVTLKIKSIVADGGPILYRYRPRAMGRSAPIRKRTSHLTVVLEGVKEEKQEKSVKATPGKATKKPAVKKPSTRTSKK